MGMREPKAGRFSPLALLNFPNCPSSPIKCWLPVAIQRLPARSRNSGPSQVAGMPEICPANCALRCTLSATGGRADGLIFHDELHVHVVMATSALYRTFNQVFPSLLRRHQRIFLGSFFKADVPSLIAQLLHDKAVNGTISCLLAAKVRSDSQNDFFARLQSDDRLVLSSHLECIVSVSDYFNYPVVS